MNWFKINGFAGIWNDTDEPESGDEIPYNGLLWEDGRLVGTGNTDSRREWSNEHNYFGLRTAQTSYQALLGAYPTKRPLVLSRSGTAGIQRYAVCWSGDTDADWTYIRTCIRFGISAMISGAGYFGHDLGGFTGDAYSQPELMERWYEWGSLLPFCRSHARNCAWGRRVISCRTASIKAVNRGGLRIPTRVGCVATCNSGTLMPYFYTLMYNATQSGQPMNVPTAFQFSGDVNTTSLNDYDFMLGDYLLAAPVYSQGATTRTVYLPYAPGVQWYYYPNGTSSPVYNGGQTITVSAPLGDLAIVRASGAIIPMGPPMQNMIQPPPTSLNINCWPTGTSSFNMYEDAGEGWDFTNGVYAQTLFQSVRASTTWDLTINARQGSYNPGSRTFYVYCYTPQDVTDVLLNGSPLAQYSTLAALTTAGQGWTMTPDYKLAILIPGDASAKTVHVDWTGGLPSTDLGLPGTWSNWSDTNTPWQLTFVSPPGTPGSWQLVHEHNLLRQLRRVTSRPAPISSNSGRATTGRRIGG